MRENPNKNEKIVQKNNEIDSKLANIKIPYEKFPQVRDYDDLINNFRQPEIKKIFSSVNGGIQAGVKMVNDVSRMTGGWMERGMVKVINNFASKIGNQAVADFVKNSVGVIAKEGLKSGTQAVLKGLATGGVKAVATTGATAAAGAVTGPVGWIATVALMGKKIINNIADKLGINFVKKMKEGLAITGNKFMDGIIAGATFLVGIPVIIGGLTIGVGLMIWPFFGGLLGYQTIQTNLVSSLKPNIIESGGGTGGTVETKPIEYGDIIYSPEGRILDCGVGMDTDFKRNKDKNFPIIRPEYLAGGNLEKYNEQLKNAVGDQFGKKCGVVYAAQYLAFDFDYWVPYREGGRYSSAGLNPDWGKVMDPDSENRIYEGLMCDSFVGWASTNGYGKKTSKKEEIPFGNCEVIKELIEPGDALVMRENGYHIAIVLSYDNTRIKFAHCGGGSGVSTGLVDICTGAGIDQGMKFEYLQKRNY